MDYFPTEVTYFLLVCIGAFAVGVHSHSMYSKRVPSSIDTNAIGHLDAVALPTVAGETAFRRGFAAYLLANEFLYLALTSSTTILELSLNAVGKADLVGALNTGESLNTVIPILASTVVITASQIRPLAQLEQSIRGVSHRIAGIPRNVNTVQELIRSTSSKDIERHLGKEKSNRKDRLGNTSRLLAHADKRSTEISNDAKQAGLGAFESENLRISLMRVNYLYEWTLGYDGEQIWVSDEVKKIISLFSSLKLEFRSFSDNISRLRSEKNPGVNDQFTSQVEIWQKVLSESLALERRLTVVLSILLINKPDVELGKYRGLAFVRDQSVESDTGLDRKARSSWGISLMSGSFVAYVSIIVYLSLEKTLRDWDAIQQAKKLLLAPFGDAEKTISTSWLSYISDRMDNAFLETLDYVLIFGVSTIVTLIARDALRVQKRWSARNFDITPVGDYFYLAFLSYLPSVMLFLILKFLVLNILLPLKNGLQVMDSASLESFSTYLPNAFTVPICAFVCSWFICSYLDNNLWKRAKPATVAFRFALYGGTTNFTLAILRGDLYSNYKAAASFFVPFLVLFCLFYVFCYTYRKILLEEEKDEKKEDQDAESKSTLSGNEIKYRANSQKLRRANLERSNATKTSETSNS